ncbi:PREDICTED: putative F-box protein At3g17480 [Erythranthe guttata]|nr:PREDICTED: putative F-box protein At3g17480 [Erythranthe guttata]|eukprot:XP_012833043.1 PREDICTED: putative F-box protein At3g17480 [Erythranthe guttata]
MKTDLEFQTSRNGGVGQDPTEEEDQQPQQVVAAAGEPPTDLDSIPDGILEEIFTRVPAKTVFCCMAVNTKWLSILDNRTFFKRHHSLSSARPLVVFSDPSGRRSNRVLHLYEGRDLPDYRPMPARSLGTRIDFPDTARGRCTFLHGVNSFVTSCKGLVCWATHRGAGDVVLSNPITGEYVLANAHARGMNSLRELASVFVGVGYSRETKTFELLKMILALEDDPVDYSMVWYPELLALGGNSWRPAGEALQFDFSRMIYNLVNVDDGTIYWRYKDDSSICTFDFDRTLFRVVDLPDFEGPVLKTVSLGVLDDTLCASFASPDGTYLELWSAKTIDNCGARGVETAWKMLHRISINTSTAVLENNGRVWNRGAYRPVMHVENNKILMHDRRTNFRLYDVVTGSETVFPLLEDINDNDEDADDDDDDGHPVAVQVVSLVPNIICLQETLNIQEGNIRVLRTESR